jgi:translation initiation factor 4G
MKVCFAKIGKLSNSKALPARSRFMYKDLLDLRSSNWVPRRKEEKAKTIAEIRKDVEREEQKEARENAAANQGNYRGNNYGGRGGKGGGDYRNNNRSNYGNNSNRSRQQRQVIETDDDGFTTIVGGAKQLRGGSSLAQAANQKPQRILQSKPKQAATAKPSHPPLDDEKFERRVKSIRSEYIQDPKNLQELFLSMDELTGTKDYGSKFVSKNADHMIDCKESERAAIYTLLEICVKEGKISSNDVKAGLVDIVEFIDAYVCDAPFAFDYLGRMLATMIRCNAIDVTWVGTEAEKTKVSSEANPEKIILSLMKAIDADKGVEAVKGAFGPHQKIMEKLLGIDKWASIKKEIA